MNRPICFIEFKNGDVVQTAKQWMLEQLERVNRSGDSLKNWALYCNDKRVDRLEQKVRPKSRLLMVNRVCDSPKIEVIHQHKKWVLLNKPAGLPTQATLKAFEDNLYERVRYHFIKEKNFPIGLPYVGLHHRLDRGTSGLVLMTLQRSANLEVSKLFKDRRIQKTYRALTVLGDAKPPKTWKQVDRLSRKTSKKKKFFFAVSEEGDEAITLFKHLGSDGEFFNEFHCFPKTGRTHQLRVQLAHKGFPILGDPVYGDKKSAKRLMLHAEALEFSFQGEKYAFKAPLPGDWGLSGEDKN